MEIAFRELDHKGVLVYLDDVLVGHESASGGVSRSGARGAS